MPTDEELVLHMLVVKGFCSAESLAAGLTLPVTHVTAILTSLATAGTARHRDGKVSGWSPTASGREQHQTLLTGPLAPRDMAGARVVYEEFGVLNADFKQVCTDWQIGPGRDDPTQLNDHTDAAYDDTVIDRLRAIDTRVGELCRRLDPNLPRVMGYRARLAEALGVLLEGNRDMFTKPLTGSYHDVWMELHHDLLLSLGLQRTEADA